MLKLARMWKNEIKIEEKEEKRPINLMDLRQ